MEGKTDDITVETSNTIVAETSSNIVAETSEGNEADNIVTEEERTVEKRADMTDTIDPKRAKRGEDVPKRTRLDEPVSIDTL